MDRQREALYAILAVTLGFVERGRLLREWPATEGVRERLTSRGLLTAAQAEAIDRVVQAHLARHNGSAEKALAVCSSADPALLSSLVDEMRTATTPAGDDSTRAVPAAQGVTERFVLGAELGRGGLGRVVAAWDNLLRRDVAIKLVLDGLPAALLKRFAREAEITGRLEHPNIVPVHDFGPQVGGARLGLCMKRVHGRDLQKLLEDLAKGDATTRKKYSLQRLLRVYQDICLAVAFAHDRGVIHRDLKPSNVMIGDFGETLVVDWGLAKEVGGEDGEALPLEKSPQPGAGAKEKTVAAGATEDGAVMGTPAYMAPEQAAGRHREVDARSDVYALGAILYEILTLRPPVRGESIAEIVTNAAEGRLVPPSERVASSSALRPSDLARTVPAEVEAICLRAMAFRKEDRYGAAMEIHDEVQLFLEGVKQRERQRELAEACLRKAEAARQKREQLGREAAEALAESSRLFDAAQPFEDKSRVFAAEDRARDARRRAVEALAEEDRLVTEALGHDPGHAEARRARAELAWDFFLDAERSGREVDAVIQRGVVEQFDDGAIRARLEGTGTLALRTRFYPCRCLETGRDAAPGEFEQDGYHRFSGRQVGGRPEAAGIAELEPREPRRWKVHGRGCAAQPAAGARVWAWRFEEIGRLLVPVTPERLPGTKTAGSPAPVDAVFGKDSPFRPRGAGAYLGTTPLGPVAMPMGSWLLVVAADGFLPMRVPVQVARGAAVERDVTLWRREELGADEIPLPEGPFHFQGDPGNPSSMTYREPLVRDVAMSRFRVTCTEYAAFLNSLPARDAAAAAPRESANAASWWPGPPWDFRGAKRPGECVADWEAEWPVIGISWTDAMRFAAWRRTQDGRAWVLPTEEEWEKAARGADRRAYVCGPYLDDRWACLNRSFPDGPRVVPVGAYPHDESPYGVRGMAGTCEDYGVTTPGPLYPHWRIMRGGAWTHTAARARNSWRHGDIPTAVTRFNGCRLARLLVLR